MSDNFVQMYPLADLQKIRDNFIEELKLAASGHKTSLAFIKNPIPKKSLIKDSKIFQVMVVGGSVFEKALVKITNNKLQILKLQKLNVPLFKTKDVFLKFIAQNLNSKIELLAVSFAFGLKSFLRTGLLDGIKTLGSSKEHGFRRLVNKPVGEEIEKYVMKKIKKNITVAIANDTICLVLSGLNTYAREDLVGGIVGTGVNFAFFLDSDTIVNIESANFYKFEQSQTGRLVDKASKKPDYQLFEKEVAGAYLYQHYNILKHQNGEKNKDIKSTLELNEIAKDTNRPDCEIAQKLFERSASLVATQMAGIYFYKLQIKAKIPVLNDLGFRQRPRVPTGVKNAVSSFSDLTFIMEGSLFWKGWNYKNMVEKYLYILDAPDNGIKFVQISQGGIIGAAQLVNGTD